MRLRKRLLPVCGMLVPELSLQHRLARRRTTITPSAAPWSAPVWALVTGAIVGSAFGRRDAAAGALIGAAAGGLGGALVGHAQDEKNQQTRDAIQAQYQQAQAAAEQRALHNDDVVYMVKTGVSDQVIINSIREARRTFRHQPAGHRQLEIERRRRRRGLRDADDSAAQCDGAAARRSRLRPAAGPGCWRRRPPGVGLGLGPLNAATGRIG